MGYLATTCIELEIKLIAIRPYNEMRDNYVI